LLKLEYLWSRIVDWKSE